MNIFRTRAKLTKVFYYAFAGQFLFSAGMFAQTKTVVLENKAEKKIVDYTVEIPANQLKLPINNYVAVNESEIVPVEVVSDIKGNASVIFPISTIMPNSSISLNIQGGCAHKYPKRTYAEIVHKIGGKFERTITERHNWNQYKGDFAWVKPNYLRVPDDFTDHAYYIKYEGPGWESDKAAFRFYLDWRNGIDVFGKKTPEIVLPFVGVDGYDNYHNMGIWGMDNMKVGDGLGIGSIAVWDGEKAVRVNNADSIVSYIKADGKIRSQVMTTYYGWNANGTKCTLESLISIDAGSRASHMELLTDKNLENLATGIIKSKETEILKSDNSNEWSYIATFGKQSLNKDMQGLVIFFRTKQLKEITEDKLNHVVVLKPDNGYVDYYFMPTWELDWEPVRTKEDLQKCIDEVMNRLNKKITVKIKE
ncbi:DUF4861 family protein [Dysgonomonas sp. 216]|uniref:DUF4861 family protein n=1 Tax=Dysgonomonas sp. 216 TaxID=2302934 RepID=UPI0013D4A7CA|nr:DUF4861 family protein [Dysgonomonas sp. 216]